MFSPQELELLKNRTLLGLVFRDQISTIVQQYAQIVEISKSESLLNEGEDSEYLFIPLTGELELYSEIGSDKITNGIVTPGRSCNTYAVLRGMPYQYSASALSSARILKFPSSVLLTALQADFELKTYLHSVTESDEARSIAKDIESYGCSKNFVVALIAGLKKDKYAPNEWIYNPSEPISKSIFILEGRAIRQKAIQDSSQLNQWRVPARSWILWKEALLTREPSAAGLNAEPEIIKAVSSVNLLSINQNHLFHLKEKFPEDFALYTSALSEAVKSNNSDDIDELDEEAELDEILAKDLYRRPFWKSYPWVQQSDQMDCGPACMAMVSKYYDHNLNIQYWRNRLSTGREGTSLFDLAQISEGSGFTSVCLEVESLSQLSKAHLPVIALRRYHYIVVYEITNTHVIVGDPGVGIDKLTHAEFLDGFENCVLFLKPTEKFFSVPESQSKYSHYLGFLKGLVPEMALSFSISVTLIFLGLLTPILSQVFLDDVLVRKDTELLKWALVGSMAVVILELFLSWAQVYYSNYLAIKFDYNANSSFMKKMLSLDYKYFSDRHVGDFTMRLGELDKLKSFLLGTAETVVLCVISVVIYGAILFLYSSTIALTCLALVPGFILISHFAGKRLSQIYQKVFKESADLEGNLTDTIKGISTIKSLDAKLASRWRFEEQLVSQLRSERNFELTSATIGVFSGFYGSTSNFVIMGLAAFMAIKGDLTPGQVAAVTMIAGRFMGPLTALAGQFGEIHEIKAVCERLNDIFLAKGENSNSTGHLRKDTLLGQIEFRDVWFRFGGEGSEWVLKGISFIIEPGSNVAIVGPSGSGKSTLAALLSRMYVPTRGQILVDGRDYLEYDLTWFRSQIGVLHQETNLFKGSILENIAYGDAEPNPTKVTEAARKAAAEDFIQKKPAGYGYHISSGGFGLSGGEKQRISVARMLYREPRILLLDEATSALDGISEKELLENLFDQTNNATTVNIAHRISTVTYSQLALVLYDGKLRGFGTHQELIEKNKIYRDLFTPQMKGLIAENNLFKGAA